MKKMKTLIIGFAICTFVITSCKPENKTENVNSESTITETVQQPKTETVQQPKTEPKPKVYLPNERVPVLRAGAGFLGTIARVRLESKHSKDVNVGIAIYAGEEKVGFTLVTIKKGELEGEEQTRLDGFMGWFEDRIPSTVTLKITSVKESALSLFN